MLLRVGLRIVPLFALFGAALWFHAELTRPAREEREARQAPRADVLSLRAGGRAPRLALRPREPGKRSLLAPHPGPKQEPAPSAEDTGRPAKVVLRDGDTLHAICVRAHGNARRLDEVLALNGLSEDAARRLRAGTTILMPR